MSYKKIILIPARYQSTRFPGKPLAKIHDKTMIEYVLEKALLTGIPSYVVTDDNRIQNHLEKLNLPVLRVDDNVSTGSERIYLALKRHIKEKIDLVINLQGDEPLINPESLKRLIQEHEKSHFDVMTLVRMRSTLEEDWINSNVVKVIFDEKNHNCLYFSRSSIPYVKNPIEDLKWYQHIGIYSYKFEALDSLVKSQPSSWEIRESLEQLRGLQLGLKYGAIEVTDTLIGVDTPEDIEKVTRQLK